MAHIEASLQRIVLNTKHIPEEVLFDPRGSVAANLADHFHKELYPDDLREALPLLHVATMVAHENRHYLDYSLTNYGSWLARFWAQIKTGVTVVLRESEQVLVPLHFMSEGAFPGFTPAISSDVRNVVTISANHNWIIDADRLTTLRNLSGLSGGSQLEVLATIFEVGAVEATRSVEETRKVSETMPRDPIEYMRKYTWPAGIFSQFGWGREHELGPIVYTRLWAPLFVAALMGEFHTLTQRGMENDPSLKDRVLPSRRFAAIASAVADAKITPTEPREVWELVQQIAKSKFGATVTESMEREIQHYEDKFRELIDPSQQQDTGALDLIAHLAMRRVLLRRLEEDPTPYIDPHTYWADLHPTGLRQAADFMLYSAEGFSEVPPGLVSLDSPMYRGQVDGRPLFLKQRVENSQTQNYQRTDEVWSTIARYLICGSQSSAWVGPELDSIREQFRNFPTAKVIPPFT